VTDRNEAGDATVRRQVSTKWEPVRAFFAEYSQCSQKEGGGVAIVEVCGFNQWLLEMLKEYGCKEIFLVPPDKRSKKKTDRRDANSLAEILWVNRARLLSGKRHERLPIIGSRLHEGMDWGAAARKRTARQPRKERLRQPKLFRSKRKKLTLLEDRSLFE
jgi:hypothetical protein